MSILKCNQGFEHSNTLHVVERALNELTLKPMKSSKAANTAFGTSANDHQEMPQFGNLEPMFGNKVVSPTLGKLLSIW